MKSTVTAWSGILLLSIFTSHALAQWVQAGVPSSEYNYFNCLAVDNANLFAGTYYGGVFLTSDGGASWTQIQSGMPDSTSVFALIGVPASNGSGDTNIFAGTDAGVYVYDSVGRSWIAASAGITDTYVKSLAAFVDSTGKVELLAGTWNGGIYRSTDDGKGWTTLKRTTPGYSNPAINAIAVSGTKVYAATNGDGVIFSTLGDTIWTHFNASLGGSYVDALVSSDSNLFAGINGVSLLTGGHTIWTPVNTGLPDGGMTTDVLALYVLDGNILVGTYDGRVYLSKENEINWKEVNDGLTGGHFNAFTAIGPEVFLATSNGVWKRSIFELATVELSGNQSPTHFGLEQNYPNPFNPSTTITYELTNDSFVVLRVFDVLGREVRTLVNERESAGNHSVRFDATNLPSGVYFYRLEAGMYHETKKLLLLK